MRSYLLLNTLLIMQYFPHAWFHWYFLTTLKFQETQNTFMGNYSASFNLLISTHKWQFFQASINNPVQSTNGFKCNIFNLLKFYNISQENHSFSIFTRWFIFSSQPKAKKCWLSSSARILKNALWKLVTVKNFILLEMDESTLWEE